MISLNHQGLVASSQGGGTIREGEDNSKPPRPGSLLSGRGNDKSKPPRPGSLLSGGDDKSKPPRPGSLLSGRGDDKSKPPRPGSLLSGGTISLNHPLNYNIFKSPYITSFSFSMQVK